MKVRHKTPTQVSMWMLDVFCCALGCVTLLWLLNNRQAGDQTIAAQAAFEQLNRARNDLSDTRTRVAALNTEAERLAARLRSALDEQGKLTGQLVAMHGDARVLQGRLDDANRALAVTRAEADATKVALATAQEKATTQADALATAKQMTAEKDKELAAAMARAKTAEADLLQKKQQIDTLTKKLETASATVDELDTLVRDTSAERAERDARNKNLQRELVALEKKLAAAEEKQSSTASAAKTASDKAKADLDAAKADAAKAAQDLAAARKTITELEGKLAGAGTDKATIIDLQGQNAKLADKLDKLQKETETRFAGIATTGRRVVFLVDMSGSMTKTDERTPAPGKWPTVCETVAKVMRSIPTLERYQVVVFSHATRWLLTPAGDWRPFEGEKSVQEVKSELLKVVVEGDTNMYDAFDMVFTLRPKGLDTIYLFSDGLPTSGRGLTPSQENTLDEAKRSEILGDYLLRELRIRWNRPLAGSERVRINSVGFFYQSPNVGAFLWALSRENDGSFVGMSKP